MNEPNLLRCQRTLFFSSFCFCLSSSAIRRFSALIRCSSSFLRRSSSCCSLSFRAFSSFSSHWVFLAAEMGHETGSGEAGFFQQKFKKIPYINTYSTNPVSVIRSFEKSQKTGTISVERHHLTQKTSFDQLVVFEKKNCLKLGENLSLTNVYFTSKAVFEKKKCCHAPRAPLYLEK